MEDKELSHCLSECGALFSCKLTIIYTATFNMCSRQIRLEFMLIAMCLSMVHLVTTSAEGSSSTQCKDTLEKEWIKSLKHCLDHTNKIDCLKKLVKAQEKVFFKRKLRKNVKCEEVSSAMDIRKVLVAIDKYKDDFSHRVAGEINKFLEQNEVSIGVGTKLTIKFLPSGNETVDMTVKFNNNDSAVSERKMKMNTSNILALLFAPAMFIAGMMPWILPGVKMAVMMVTMMNNMAFSSALFTLIRGYIFDTRPDDHILYINNGYKNHHQPVHQPVHQPAHQLHHRIYHVRTPVRPVR